MNETGRVDRTPTLPEDIEAWSSTRVRDWISTVQEAPGSGNAYWWWRVRWMAQQHAHNGRLPTQQRRDWAKTMLAASECEQRFGKQRQWHSEALDRFHMRVYVIVNLSSVPDEEIWQPATLARDVLNTLTMQPEQAQQLAEQWRTLPLDQIRLLRDHKNLLGCLVPVVGLLPDGDLSVRVHAWLTVRPKLP